MFTEPTFKKVFKLWTENTVRKEKLVEIPTEPVLSVEGRHLLNGKIQGLEESLYAITEAANTPVLKDLLEDTRYKIQYECKYGTNASVDAVTRKILEDQT